MIDRDSEAVPDRRPLLAVENLEQRLYDAKSGEQFVVTLEGRLEVHAGTFAAMLGPSGCGKTTLLTVLGLLRRPTNPRGVGCFEIAAGGRSGAWEHRDIKQLWQRGSQGEIERLRRKHIGFALQNGELLSSLKVWENIALPLRLNGAGRRECRRRVNELLAAYGMDDRSHAAEANSARSAARLANARVNKLSGGEHQRVVLARAIAHRPHLVFIDEPTSALNRELARESLRQLKQTQVNGRNPGAAIMITHDEQLADEFADVTIRMAPEKGRAAGRVVEIVDQRKNDSRWSAAGEHA